MLLILAMLFALAAGYFSNWGIGLNNQGIGLFLLVVATSFLSGYEVLTVEEKTEKEIETLKGNIDALLREVQELKERAGAATG